MPRSLWLVCLLLLPLTSHAAGLQNQLAKHASAYLAMHGADPVAWQTWGPEVMARARAENKPVFISSGYFACHWCHVMQQESYRDKAVAALLNEHFIPVKIDRELQPGLDAYLIDFVEQTRGSAGWPLNVFITPQGYPLIGLTYAPNQTFHRLLVRLGGAWNTQAEALAGMARQAAQQLREQHSHTERPRSHKSDPEASLQRLKAQALRVADELQGGFGLQNRFPMAPLLRVLLDYQAQWPDERLAGFLKLTLEQMANQGLRDHLAGGFFRYTVDPAWQIPHFEKMLYNQALHVSLYLRASEVLRIPTFREVARDTLDFVQRHMQAPAGGYLASLSAVDGQGVEGGSYLWSDEQLDALLEPRERALLGSYWGMRGTPNNEGGYLPVRGNSLEAAAAEAGLSVAQAQKRLGSVRAKLLLSRAARSLPRDDKPLAAWNGLLLSALADGVRAFGDAYREPGQRLRDFLVGKLWDGERLHRSLGPKGWIGDASLADYAYLAKGLTDWSAVAGEQADRRLAKRLIGLAWAHFHDQGWHRGQSRLLPAMPAATALPDSPLPSPAAVLIDLSLASGDAQLRQRAHRALSEALARAEAKPFSYPLTLWVAWVWRDTPAATP